MKTTGKLKLKQTLFTRTGEVILQKGSFDVNVEIDDGVLRIWNDEIDLYPFTTFQYLWLENFATIALDNGQRLKRNKFTRSEVYTHGVVQK